jgi:hypothetical protein
MCGINMREQLNCSRWRDLDNGCSCALQVRTVIEVADQNLSLYELAHGDRHARNSVWVDVAIAWYRGGDGLHGFEWADEAV